MTRICFFLLLSFIIFNTTFLHASNEVFLLRNYADDATLYRVKTNDEFYNPIGYFLDCEIADVFFVDKIKNFRFITKSQTKNEHFDLIQSYWRGARPGKALQQTLASNLLNVNYSVYHKPGNLLSPGELFFYSWQNDQTGLILKENKTFTGTIVAESKDKGKRFLGVKKTPSGEEFAYILGNDVLNAWLTKFDLTTDAILAECSLVSFAPTMLTEGFYIYIYSKANSTIYRFVVIEDIITAPEIIKLTNLEPTAMVVGESGDLYFVSLLKTPEVPSLDNFVPDSLETVIFDDKKSIKKGEIARPNEDLAEEEELLEQSIDHKPVYYNFTKRTGQIILAQRCANQIYSLNKNEKTPIILWTLPFDRVYFYLDFTFNNVSDFDFENWNSIKRHLKNPANSISELKSNPDGWPSQFIAPESYYMAAY